MPHSLSTILQNTRETFHLHTADFKTGKRKLKTQPRKVADAYARLEKGEAAIVFHLRSGHSPLNDYLHRFNHHDTGKCDHCKVPETVAHFLLHCRLYTAQRKRIRQVLKEEKIKVNPFSVPSLLNTTQAYPSLAQYALETGRFWFLKKYTAQADKPTTTSKKKRPTRWRNSPPSRFPDPIQLAYLLFSSSQFSFLISLSFMTVPPLNIQITLLLYTLLVSQDSKRGSSGSSTYLCTFFIFETKSCRSIIDQTKTYVT